MEYSIQKLARIAGVSPRTLRHYDEIGLLKPLRVSASGYRIYGPNEVDVLQQILLYRELGVELGEIRKILSHSDFEIIRALMEHHEKLIKRKKQLDEIIQNVERTIQSKQGGVPMTDEAKFQGLKKKMIDDNEIKYGAEIRNQYGNDVVDRSNRKLMGKSKAELAEAQTLAEQVNDAIFAAMQSGDPACEQAQHACELHRTWLMQYWDFYTPEAHMGLAQMYVDDERFRAYYEQIATGATEFLRDAMRIYTGIETSH